MDPNAKDNENDKTQKLYEDNAQQEVEDVGDAYLAPLSSSLPLPRTQNSE